MTILSLLSSFVNTAYNEAQEAPEPAAAEEHKEEETAEAGGEVEEAAEEEEAEEEEPEDPMPAIREECANTKHCLPAKREFEHCEKKVNEGSARPHEDCVEEFTFPFCTCPIQTNIEYSLMHCVDNCSAPKLFSKLR
ncbi:hypothetical protein DACRYDRAFT_80841 [Dacryopinax primogenitus]|uniref:Ubiquinol-cytochrome C reductase hinge domain-containing protein n=1 Tax=Dacryopinax primogenitus (strain DJM 731) TaxID=1858805 RepID=M5G462_DACPD|nr:uncharacterized protein DACRYDRAFT_80841 [Dacryopinax primogenitus]EJU00622.1 hypothetical protein DACRYDRAFT_80841 [Dacryopinax primogenitus]